VLLVAESFLIKDFKDTAQQCQIDLLPVSDYTAAKQAVEEGDRNLILIAVNQQVVLTSVEDNMRFADSIHHQTVGDIGKLLEWIRIHTQSQLIRVGLFCSTIASQGPPLILRLMGCDYVFNEFDLRDNFLEIVTQFFKLNRSKDKLSNQIFLSYVREDEVDVINIYHKLLGLRLNPWVDIMNISPGAIWLDTIQEAIQNSDFFLPHFSTNTVLNLGIFQRELQLALARWSQRRMNELYHVVPVRLDDCTIPAPFTDFQWVKITETNSLTRLLQALVLGIMRIIPRGNGERVLIVDKDRDIRELCVRMLDKFDYTPLAFDNPDTALHEFEANPSLIPIVILALMGYVGLPMLKALRPWNHTTKVILTTKLGDPFIPALQMEVFRCLPLHPHFGQEILLYVHEALKELRQSGTS